MSPYLSLTLLKTLNVLNDCKIHSGAGIAEKLGISRTAVWKVIQRLKKYHVNINASHQGYQLETPLILLDQKKIERMLKHSHKINLEIFETIPSTSDYLKQKSGSKSLDFCLAEHQTKARGRLGRAWIAPFGKNIYCSFTYIFNKDMSELSGLSLVTGILVSQALNALDSRLNPMLKWPNDIQINHQKVGGILIDIDAEAYSSCKAVIGLGLNVNMRGEKLKGINQPWTSLEHSVGRKFDRNVIMAEIIKALHVSLEVFTEKGMAPFLKEWEKFDCLKDQKIVICASGKKITGIAQGITKEGHLILKTSSGAIESFSSGDATLLKTPQEHTML